MCKIIILTVFLTPFFCHSQKIKDGVYKKVDTLIEYDDAEIVFYKNKSQKGKSDTLYYSKMNSVTMEDVRVTINYKGQKLNNQFRLFHTPSFFYVAVGPFLVLLLPMLQLMLLI